VQVEERDYGTGEAERYSVHHDVSGNSEPVPAFGDYDSIARRERA
jgi:hypothetical protein